MGSSSAERKPPSYENPLPAGVTSLIFTTGANVMPPSVERRNASARVWKSAANCSQATFTSPVGPTTTCEPCTPASPHVSSSTAGADQVAPPSVERTISIVVGKSLGQVAGDALK